MWNDELGVDDMNVRDEFDAIEQGFSRREPYQHSSGWTLFLHRIQQVFYRRGAMQVVGFALRPTCRTSTSQAPPCLGETQAPRTAELGAPTIVSEVQRNRDLPYETPNDQGKGRCAFAPSSDRRERF